MKQNYPIPKIKLTSKFGKKLKNWVHTFIKYLILFLTILEKIKNIFDF